MVKQPNELYTPESKVRLKSIYESSYRQSVPGLDAVDRWDLIESFVPRGLVTIVREEFFIDIGMRIAAFAKLIESNRKKGKVPTPEHLALFEGVKEFSMIPDSSCLTAINFKGSLHGHQKTGKMHHKFLVRTYDKIAKKHRVPLATWTFQAERVIEQYCEAKLLPYYLTDFGTSNDVVLQAVERHDITVERQMFRDLATKKGSATRARFDGAPYGTHPASAWYEDYADGICVATSTYVYWKEIGDEAFQAQYPWIPFPPKRGVRMWSANKSFGFDFRWHLRMLLGPILTLARTGEILTPADFSKWTLKNVLGYIEKSTRKEREQRAALALHTYDLLEKCLGHFSYGSNFDYRIYNVALPKAKGEFVAVILNSKTPAAISAFLMSCSTVSCRYCLGGNGSDGAGNYLPIIAAAKIQDFAELQKWKMRENETSIGYTYLKKVLSGEIELMLFFHKINNDVILPIGAAEIVVANKKIGQLKGYRNGALANQFIGSLAGALNWYLYQNHIRVQDFKGGDSHDLTMNKLKWSPVSRRYVLL